MVTLYRKYARRRFAEMTVIYLFLLLAALGSAWLPYFFVQWTYYRAGFAIP